MNHGAGQHRASDKTRVRDFLAAMERRDLAKAEGYLARSVVMRFPGAPPFHDLHDVVSWARTRYRSVRKTFHAVDHCVTDEASIVVCHGELSVIWLDGTTTEGVRFIDRFELEHGLITRQDVWNDLALAPGAPLTGQDA